MRTGMKRFVLLPGGLFALALLAFLLVPAEPGPGIEERAQSTTAADPERLSVRIIPEDDLPPEGSRSLFDHLIAENGSLPYPFDRVIEMLAAYDVQGRAPNTLMIPDGRSLLKGFASFDRPRIVLAADMRAPDEVAGLPLFSGRLFLGFVEDAREIEVISWNERAGRFEFQLVENYCADCVPRIVYAKRAVCTTCHAGGRPIFPVRPWEETNAQAAIHSRIGERIGADSYFGAPVARRLDNAEAFDNLTDVGGMLPVLQSVWLDGCGADGQDCRREMLRLALEYGFNPASLDADHVGAQQLQALQARNWPAAGIALSNGDLNNRNPLEQDLYTDSLLSQLRGLLRPREEVVRSGDKLSDFDNLPPLPAAFDPLTPRVPHKWLGADDLDGVYALAQLLSAADHQRLQALAGYDWTRLDEAVDTVPAEFFDPAPVRRSDLLTVLYQALGHEPPNFCCLDASEMSPPIAQGEPPLELAEGSVLEPFERYCFACHRGNPAARLDFMSGPDEATVLKKIRDTGSIRDALDFARYQGTRKEAQLMPPADSAQRAAMLRAIERGEDPRAAMLEQVPSLFDF